jgi:hypothetical protein
MRVREKLFVASLPKAAVKLLSRSHLCNLWFKNLLLESPHRFDSVSARG